MSRSHNKSESEKTDKPPKPTEEEIEEFGEDKEDKKNSKAVVSGAKTGKTKVILLGLILMRNN